MEDAKTPVNKKKNFKRKKKKKKKKIFFFFFEKIILILIYELWRHTCGDLIWRSPRGDCSVKLAYLILILKYIHWVQYNNTT